jgi:carboxymethylenebutenolidase
MRTPLTQTVAAAVAVAATVAALAGCRPRSGAPAVAAPSSDAAAAAASAPSAPASPPPASDGAGLAPTELRIPGPAGALQAWLWRPAGLGPFPVLVYNHGSEQDPIVGTRGRIGPFFVQHGWAVLFPSRRGSGRSDGTWWRHRVESQPDDQHEPGYIRALVEENDDIVAAFTWLRAQPWVARDDLAVAGCSFGGIESLLTAEREVAGLRAVVDFAGGAMSWTGSPALQVRMRQAVEAARVPIFFVQAENDFNTEPSRVLAEAMQKKGKPHRLRIFPPFGQSHMEGHARFCLQGTDVWGQPVLDFLERRR